MRETLTADALMSRHTAAYPRVSTGQQSVDQLTDAILTLPPLTEWPPESLEKLRETGDLLRLLPRISGTRAKATRCSRF